MIDPRTQILVVGSVNMDLVVSAPRIPRPGETIIGGRFDTFPGGKGANQAVAAARLGADVALVGRVGDDANGRSLRATLQQAGVDCRYVRTTAAAASGVALIVVSEAGENAICVAPGANGQLMPQDIDEAEALLAAARVCIVQLEVPLPTVLRMLELARRHGVETILDPAPVPAQLPDGLLDVDILTPNQSEAAQLLHTDVAGQTSYMIANQLRARGARAVVLKLGAQGAFVRETQVADHVPAHVVDVVDSTAAGDAFTAALAVGRSAGVALSQAARFANAAGALTCAGRGAQPSLPTRAEVEALLSSAAL
ncbi:MAG: ribokinase [Planctomycetes bacterium]|nr:ribokinase [Planctomycetota bacterium]